MGRFLRQGVLFAMLSACAAPALAVDPVVMFLLGVARDALINSIAKELSAPRPVPPPAYTYPGTVVEPAELRRLIDGSFAYLSESQRQEIFDSLNAALLDPKNAAVRASMIDYFAQRALAMRMAQQRLEQMSFGEKRQVAADFGRQVAELPRDEADLIAGLLRQRLLPVPSDLNELLLAAVAGS